MYATPNNVYLYNNEAFHAYCPSPPPPTIVSDDFAMKIFII